MQKTKVEQKEEQDDRCFLCDSKAVHFYPTSLCGICRSDWAE